ncbi:ABC transporter permease [Erythrobacter sp. SG61-1L]|uniref:ABC transporter permease n=1 Tax=Erythrobacter sp. SG61-1L TaxID=1603897 RepID=UPI0006C90619|nr:FtsX-like permease family protein [Erythrobacter sp. SG61-1L]KPL69726.1 ABC transporter permease [Erythrobacter sp. SG61-1L]KPL69821.1 ABC transporter permease [Erythrobacter sp. SG61-1L]
MTRAASTSLPWATAWAIARRDLHRRFRGLRLLLVCLFLGVGALAAIGSLTGAIEGELKSRGKEILGGDLEVSLWQRAPTVRELMVLNGYGRVSGGLRMQATASAGDMAAPIELKAVDSEWPMFGSFTLKDGTKAGAPPEGQAWLAQGAAERLGVGPGDSFRLGTQVLKVGGIIGEEPDRLSEGFALGPTVIVPFDLPEEAGLVAPGAMYQGKYRIAFGGRYDAEGVSRKIGELFPSAGFEFRNSDNASPGADRFVSRMGQFLVLVGLAALVIAGIGIGGGVSSYLQARRTGIATLKILGATSGDIARIYALQLGAAALAGALAGLIAGIAITPLLSWALGSLLPVQTGLVIDLAALARAAGFGLLVALIFAAPPLEKARRFPAMALMRERVMPLAREWRGLLLPVGGGLVAIAALALIGTPQPGLSAIFMGGAAGLLAILALLGWAIRRAAERAPRPRNPLLRNALANLHRPGAQTGALVTALGFGLSAFVLLAGVQTSLDANIQRSVPQMAPDYFVLDIPRARIGEFEDLVRKDSPKAEIRSVPTLRGKILAYGPKGKTIRVADLDEIPEGAWPLRGERGLTYSDGVPEGNTVTAGKWWPKDYSGEPLVSIDEELAQVLGLKIGDYITVGLLGVERSARIASFRRIDWDSMGFNYVLVFSPNAIADAPHNLAATIDLPDGAATGPLLRQMVRTFPSSSVIEVGQVLGEARAILSQVGAAILAAASVAVLAGLAVLLGAIAAARASRLYDNVILRVLGASRKQLLLLQLAEYGLLALVLAGVALVLGSGLAWLVIVQLFEFDWLPDWPRILAVLGAGLALVLGFALGGSLPLLRARPAQALREL